ncbi:MAG: manganese efflux pump [Ruminococcus sp.]|nr:manganese efflux pump [Ruminococcus sp.]
MGIIDVVVLSIGLAMDAFSVAVCKGLSMKKIDYKAATIIALFFGVFQGGMPLIGYFLGSRFMKYISAVDHWVAFILLAFIGGKMLWEVIKGGDEEEDTKEFRLDLKELTILAIATSIDALAVGIVFAAQDTEICSAVLSIGIITAAISFAGVFIGNRFGSKYESKAQIAGGIILILIGLKILLEDLGVL